MIIKKSLIVTALSFSLSCSSAICSSTAWDDVEKSFAKAKKHFLQRNETFVPDKIDVSIETPAQKEIRQQNIEMYQDRLKELEEREKEVIKFLKSLRSCQEEIESEMQRLGDQSSKNTVFSLKKEGDQALSSGREPYNLRSGNAGAKMQQIIPPIRKNRPVQLEAKQPPRKK